MSSFPPRLRLAELAEQFELELRGDPDHHISGIGTLQRAVASEISFLANKAYRKELRNTGAGAVILNAADADICPSNCLISKNPYVSYAKVAGLFQKPLTEKAQIHATAVVSELATLGAGVSIGPHAVIESGATVGPGCSIGAGSMIGANVRLGKQCTIHANVTIMDDVCLGDRVIVHAGAVLGADGFGIAFDQDHWLKVPQLGTVLIGNDCEIGANTAIDRGAIEDTVLGNDVRLDNLVQVGHNVVIGDHTAIAGCTAIAGSARIGKACLIGGKVGILGHIKIADHVTISAMSAVSRNISESGTTWASGLPARPLKDWQRNQTHLHNLNQIVNRVRELEKKHREPESNE